jgi:hypothetical protein
MPQYRYTTTVKAPTGVALRFDSDSSGTTPVAVYANQQGAPIDQTNPRQMIHADQRDGSIQTVFGDAATVYVRQIDYKGNVVAGVIATIAGAALADGQLDPYALDLGVNAKRFGAVCNAKIVAVGITAGQAALSKSVGSFAASDAGKTVVVPGAGAARSVADAAMTSGSTTLTSATAAFTGADVRSTITVAGAGPAGAALVGTITKVSSATTISVSVAASTTVSGAAVTLVGYLSTTIASVSGGVATLAATAGATVSAVNALCGTDDTAALAATHAAVAAAGGGVVLIPGSCLVSAALTPASNVEIRGTRSGATTVYMASTTATPFAFLSGVYSTGAPLAEFKLRDLTIDGLYMQMAFNVGIKGAFLQYLSSCVFENLVVQNTLATGLGVDFLTKGTTIRNVKAINCGAGSWAGAQGGGSAGIGIGTGGFTLEQFTIEGCHAEGNGTFGIFIEGQGGTTTPGMRIVNCTASGNHLSGFCDAGGSGAQWIGCWSYLNDFDGFTNASGTLPTSVPGNDTIWANCVANNNGRMGFAYYPFRFGNSSNYQPNAVARVSWNGCKSYANANQGFYVQTQTAGVIDGLAFNDCESYLNGSSGLIANNTGTVKNFRVTGGAYYNNGQTSGTDHFGIRVNCTADTVSVGGGVRCYDNGGTQKQTHGLALSSGVTITNLTVQTADMRGNLTAAVSTGATLAGTVAIRDVVGYNPVGSAVPGTAFALPASTVAWTNNTGVDGTLAVTAAGTVTAVSVNGVSVGTSLAVGQQYRVKAGGTFTLTYSVAPTLVFVGD